MLEHDASMLVGIIGAFKAGKICVPVDPKYHKGRAGYILEDSQSALIVSNTKNISLAAELAPETCDLINIDDIYGSFPSENPALSIAPDRPSYILYTSGSTGEPKGVLQNQRNLLCDLRGYTNSFHICADDRLTLFASCSGGEGMKNALSALLNGATVYPYDIRNQGFTGLANWLNTERITIYISTPIIFRSLVETLSGEQKFAELRLIRLGSGTVHKQDVELYKKYFSAECVLVNLLSSTETGIFAHYFIDKNTQISGDSVPVGYEAEEKQILLLDNQGRQVGIDQIGEITVRSRYLSTGYWRRPELTENKFLPDPNRPEERIYLTGDLGRMRPDGCLEYVGRKDFQVKVRGNRIELAEIEGALLEIPGIKEALAVARSDQLGDERIIAYFVPRDRSAPPVGALRGLLEKRLPPYMIPSAFVLLERFPLTPICKVDRDALPAPGSSRPDLEAPFVQPITPVEEQLAKIWAQVLGIDRIGIHDNFFDLGGHSLAATRVVSQVLKTFQLELSLPSLFQSPTVAEMAVVIAEHRAKELSECELQNILEDLESMSDEQAQGFLSGQGETKNEV